jgi:hypothetical protein
LHVLGDLKNKSLHGKKNPALSAGITSSMIFMLQAQDFPALRARITVYFKFRTRLLVFLPVEHENPALTA